MRPASLVLPTFITSLVTLLTACPPPAGETPDAGPGEPPAAAQVSLLFGETTRGTVDGTGRGARFDSVTCLELSPDGATLYASDTFVGALRAIDTDTGAVTTIAGVANESSVSDGAGGEARLGEPRGLGLTQDGATLYFADSSVLRALDIESGAVTSLVGIASEPGYVDGDAVSGRLGFLNHDLAVDGDDARVFLADRSNNVVRVYDVAGETLGTFAGPFNGPGGLSRDGDVLYVADTFAGALQSVSLDDGAATLLVSGLDSPQGVTFDGDDALYALGFSGVLQKLSLQANELSTVTTSVPLAGSFASPVIDRARGRLYYPDLETSALMTVDLATGEVSTLAGPVNPTGFVDGPIADARFGWIYGLAAASDGQTVYVADSENGAVRVVDLATGVVRRITSPGWVSPVGVALDEDAGRLYVSDSEAGTVSTVTLDTEAVTTLASDLGGPWGIALGDGGLFVTEYDNGALSRLDTGDGTRTEIATGFSGANGVAVDGDVVFVSEFGAGRVQHVRTSGEKTTLASGIAGAAGVALLAGELYVAAADDHTLLRVNRETGETTTALGRSGIGGAIGTAPVDAVDVTLTSPEAVAVTPGGLLVSVEYGVYLVPAGALR